MSLPPSLNRHSRQTTKSKNLLSNIEDTIAKCSYGGSIVLDR